MAKFLVIFAVVVLGGLGLPASNRQDYLESWFSTRIVGGSDAPKGSFPYLAQIRKTTTDTYYCGASIINAETILTTKLCVNIWSPQDLYVVVGTNKLSMEGHKYKISEIKVHTPESLVNPNIAILILSSPIKFSKTVKPIKLETKDVGGDEDCVVSGWGARQFGGPITNHLQFVYLKTMTTEFCNLFYQGSITDGEICTYGRREKGTCTRDKGGPMVANNKQVGIISKNLFCAVGYPDVYTRVSYYIDWIRKNAKGKIN